MKNRFLIICAFACVLGACASTPTSDPTQAYIDEATPATRLADQVTLAADAAVKAGALKGADADTTLATLQAARDGLKQSKKLLTDGNPTAALTALRVNVATLTALQLAISTGSVK